MDYGARSTQKAILEILKRGEGKMTALQICHPLGITPVAVRRHLAALMGEGLVRVEVKRMPVGRPVYLYSLTEAAEDLFPQHYALLLLELLEDLANLEGREKVELLFRRRKERLKSAYAPRLKGRDLEGRVGEMALILSESGCMATCQRLPGGNFILKESHCTLAQVAERFQEVCDIEREMLEELIQAKVERLSHIAQGDSYCSYLISKEGSP